MTDLLSSVIAAHGGLDRWRTVRAIDVTFNFSGGLLELKGHPGHRRPSGSVDAATPRTVFQRLGDESDERWIFTPNLVWIERRDGTIVKERSDPRAAFAGHVRETPGDRLHLTYFLGYAVWNYLTTPFLFSRTGFATREIEAHVEGRDTWRVLETVKSGIRVNGVAPGPTDTGMLTRFTGMPENKLALVTGVPMGRLGLSEELANAIVFIASDEASFITGHILNVDGGHTAN